jgi:hypothetical protein
MHHVYLLAAAFLGIACAAKVISVITLRNDATLFLTLDISFGAFAKASSQNKIYVG